MRKTLFLILILIFVAALGSAAGPAAAAYKMFNQLPGTSQSITSLAEYVAAVYRFGMMAVGLVALGVIVFAGIEYTVSAGNASKQEDAIKRIKEAILGIMLLLGAYLILYSIDPRLTSLKDPNLPVLPLYGDNSGVILEFGFRGSN
ncbi:MAG: hypothetical protein HZA37_00255 [Parcubacteria group bacterium]|nr:hypothetical protein [Parcubacteria group bacterium]